MKELKLSDILSSTADLSKKKKVGHVAIIGRPNAGKSTFINALLGEKVSIITSTPQTTRRKVLGIYNDEESQIIFFDTPGIHESNKMFNAEINNVAIKSLSDADLVLYFIDSSREGGNEEKYIKGLLANIKTNVLKVYTKSDLKSKIIIPDNENNFYISSVNKDGFNDLMIKIKSELTESEILYPEDIYTKQDIFFRISEIIREKVFLHTKEELPHSTYIGVEEIEDKDKILKIVAYVYTETDSQKYIVIGKGGSLLTLIGRQARQELEKIFGKKVFLALRVKVNKNWRKDERLVKKILN